jgi:hypothetical protein
VLIVLWTRHASHCGSGEDVDVACRILFRKVKFHIVAVLLKRKDETTCGSGQQFMNGLSGDPETGVGILSDLGHRSTSFMA